MSARHKFGGTVNSASTSSVAASEEGTRAKRDASLHEASPSSEGTVELAMPPMDLLPKGEVASPSPPGLTAMPACRGTGAHDKARPFDKATLFQDRVFDKDDWTAHTSHARYFMEPLVLCVYQLLLLLAGCLAVAVRTCAPGRDQCIQLARVVQPGLIATCSLSECGHRPWLRGTRGICKFACVHRRPSTCRVKLAITLAIPMLWVLLVACVCALYEELLRGEDDPTLDDLNLTFSYSLVGFALSLLLIFKTNTSFARFWEGVFSWAVVRQYDG